LDPALRCRIGDAAREHVNQRLGLNAFRSAIAGSGQLPPMLPSLPPDSPTAGEPSALSEDAGVGQATCRARHLVGGCPS